MPPSLPCTLPTGRLPHRRTMNLLLVSINFGIRDAWGLIFVTVIHQQRLYQYHAKPPQNPVERRRCGIDSVKEWGDIDVQDGEEWVSFEHLDEFESTDFKIVAHHHRRSYPPTPLHVTTSSIEICSHAYRLKRVPEGLGNDQPVKRSKLDTSSILGLIPEVGQSPLFRCRAHTPSAAFFTRPFPKLSWS